MEVSASRHISKPPFKTVSMLLLENCVRMSGNFRRVYLRMTSAVDEFCALSG